VAGRSSKPVENRRKYHAEKVERAETPKSRLWAYCHWLVAEAFHAGPTHLDATTDMIRTRIAELAESRKEPNR
jgi:hypothetical protein